MKIFRRSPVWFQSYAFSKPAVGDCSFIKPGLDNPSVQYYCFQDGENCVVGSCQTGEGQVCVATCTLNFYIIKPPFKGVWETRHCLKSVCLVWPATKTSWKDMLWCICPPPPPPKKKSFLGLVWPWCALPSIFCASEMGRLDTHDITTLWGSSGEDEKSGWSSYLDELIKSSRCHLQSCEEEQKRQKEEKKSEERSGRWYPGCRRYCILPRHPRLSECDLLWRPMIMRFSFKTWLSTFPQNGVCLYLWCDYCARGAAQRVCLTSWIYCPGQKKWDNRAHVAQARDLSSLLAPMFGLRACLNVFGHGSTKLLESWKTRLY